MGLLLTLIKATLTMYARRSLCLELFNVVKALLDILYHRFWAGLLRWNRRHLCLMLAVL